jgi:hypothetical protein
MDNKNGIDIDSKSLWEEPDFDEIKYKDLIEEIGIVLV